MSKPTLIFCAADFLTTLKAAFPDSLVLPFSETIKDTKTQIATLDTDTKKEAWLLFQSIDQRTVNESVVDHINLSTKNTLIGPADLSEGPRFPDMSSVYEHEGNGVIIVLGQDTDLDNFEETWVSVSSGVWEAIALKHRGFKIHGWLIADLNKWLEKKT